MKAIPETGAFRELSSRIIWFEPPHVAMSNVPRFLAYAFRYATYQDMQLLRTVFDDEHLRVALRASPPGVIDGRSWSFWHAKLGVFPPPPMPVRTYFINAAQKGEGIATAPT